MKHIDEIKNMFTDEMAKFIDNMFDNGECEYCEYRDIDYECRCPQGRNCIDGHKLWLESEAS